MHSLIRKSKVLIAQQREAYAALIETYAQNRELHSGKLLHARLIIKGLACLTYFGCKLVAFYTECGQISDARKLFDRIPRTNERRWIVLIGALAQRGFHQVALGVFGEMQREGIRPSKFVLPSVAKACGTLRDRHTGEQIHAVVLRHSFESDAYVASALIFMYSKWGLVGKAVNVFNAMVEKDLVALNAMVSGYAQQGFVREALELVERMKAEGLKPNVVTWNTLVAGFSQLGDESMVSELFQAMQINGVEPDVVSWTSVISGLVQNFRNKAAFDTFKQMMNDGHYPTSATLSSLLPACANVADLRRGKEIHGYALALGVEKDIFVRSALVDMYAKCGFITEAKTLFHGMMEKNTVTWNSMIFGYANHDAGRWESVVRLKKMIKKRKLQKIPGSSWIDIKAA
ncbi:Pentatricopeptide repeat [Dillenia turbinata]|uniref:Pentatricopeptide repeat n=1 Tax=Dillenia turbinata TaxID=194707 RepID=A0AAN8VTJ0_9MAGN